MNPRPTMKLIFNTFLPCAAVLASLTVLVGCSEAQYAEADIQGGSCIPARVSVVSFPEDSLSEADQCRLFQLAVEAISSAGPETGLTPSDHSAVSSVLFTPVTRVRPDGAVDSRAWHVSLTLQGRPYDAEIIVDRSTGEVTASRMHKPIY